MKTTKNLLASTPSPEKIEYFRLGGQATIRNDWKNVIRSQFGDDQIDKILNWKVIVLIARNQKKTANLTSINIVQSGKQRLYILGYQKLKQSSHMKQVYLYFRYKKICLELFDKPATIVTLNFSRAPLFCCSVSH